MKGQSSPQKVEKNDNGEGRLKGKYLKRLLFFLLDSVFNKVNFERILWIAKVEKEMIN